ncbi:MAG: nicotinate-nucleotide adenylyltransferase [Bacteroidales bacterium]|nr:nicotinate-nucleotide adenylyltransferase [Bacteroidales bacterium]
MALSRQKTGLFFGSFNPIHIGHMILANYMLEFTDLKEIWFVVSPQNPFKKKKTLLNNYDRLELVNRAIEGNEKLRASDVEFNMPKPSYTIDTLTYLHEKYPGRQFVLIGGKDILPTFNRWKNYEKILEYYELYIYPRPHAIKLSNIQQEKEDKLKAFAGEISKHRSIKMIDAPMVEISSSFIRASIGEGYNVGFLIPEKAYQYITEMNFYRD